MKPIVGSLSMILFQHWCIDIHNNEPHQNTAQNHDQFHYESDIRLPELNKTWYISTYTPGLKIKIRHWCTQNSPNTERTVNSYGDYNIQLLNPHI